MPDIVVIGGGIAGMSVAALLSQRAEVTLVEQESVLAYHTTGRSASLFFEPYGSEAIRPLTRASKPFLLNPPNELVNGPLLTPRGALFVARDTQLPHLAEAETDDVEGCFRRVTGDEACELQPVLRGDYVAAGLYDPSAMDIDVAGLHQAYVRMFRAGGGTIETSAPVVGLEHVTGGWTVSTSTTTLMAEIVVNTAGAWGDVVAGFADLAPVGLAPLRRTAFMVASDPTLSETPITAGVEFGFYFKPDGTQMLCSLGEEELDVPSDARPREIDVALAIERINTATTLNIRHVRSSWTGHRTFAPDGAPVTGFDSDQPDFFWLVGQGGTGIQTAPGSATLAANLILDGRAPAEMLSDGLDLDALSPDRFR